jgi:hypothetical protein
MITLSPPTFVTGALLSASMLNTLTECANALQGASQAPTGIFYRTGNDNTYWMRRKWDYLHVTYQTSGDAATTKIFVNGAQIWSDETLRPAGYTHNTSLVGISGGPAVGDFYRVEVRYTDEDNASTNTLNVFESNQLSSAVTGGTYTSPHSWGATDTPTAAQLNTIGTAITQLAPIIVSPSPVLYRVTTSTTFTLQRRLRYLNVAYNASGDASNRLLVNGTSVYNEETTGNGITVQIDLTGVSGGPAVGNWYSFEFRNQSGAAMLTDLYESGTVPAGYAPTWSHGDTLPNATNLNKYKTVLDAVEAITDVIPWHHAITYKTVDHPQWTLRKTKRYLHYIRNGSTAATLKDPASVYDDTSLSTDSTGYGSLDLDSVDWLAPGGTFYVHEADTLWLDEEA